MKCIISFLLLLSCTVITRAQNAVADSLDRHIALSVTDTGRINGMIKKISYLIEVNLDSAATYSHKTIDEARQYKYKKGEAEARMKLATVYCFKGNYGDAEKNMRTAEKIIVPLGDSSSLGRLYAGYGMMYGMQSKYDSAVLFYEKSIAIAQQRNDRALLRRNFQNIAISYQMQSNYAQSLSYLQKAMQMAEQDNDVNGKAYISLNTALTYKSMGDTMRSEQSMLESVDFSKQAQIKNVELYAYSNLASLYEATGKFQKAYYFALKAAALGGDMGDNGIKAASLAKAASALSQQKKFSDAEELAQQAIHIADSTNQPYNIYQAYNVMGTALTLQGKYASAIPFFEKAFSSIKNTNVYDETIGQSYANLSMCYEKTGDFDKALVTYKTAAAIADSVRSKENIRKATELTMTNEFERKQQAGRIQQARKDAVAKSQQLLLLVGLSLTFVLAGVIFYAYRNKQKATVLLRQQKTEIEDALSDLKNTQAQLVQREKMASLGELTAGIAHEIQNPLNFVNNFSEVNKELIEELEQEIDQGSIKEVKDLTNRLKENEQKIVHHGKRADAIVKSMLLHPRTATDEKQETDINALAEEYLRLSYLGMRAKDKLFNALIETKLDTGIGKINVVPQDMGRVLLNLFNNAFYAVHEKKKHLNGTFEPAVSVSTKRVNDTVEIHVKDNGTGIPQKVADKIFQPFFTTKPTGEGTGLGLSLSYDIVTKGHGGTLTLLTTEGEGTAFIVSLPGNNKKL